LFNFGGLGVPFIKDDIENTSLIDIILNIKYNLRHKHNHNTLLNIKYFISLYNYILLLINNIKDNFMSKIKKLFNNIKHLKIIVFFIFLIRFQ